MGRILDICLLIAYERRDATNVLADALTYRDTPSVFQHFYCIPTLLSTYIILLDLLIPPATSEASGSSVCISKASLLERPYLPNGTRWGHGVTTRACSYRCRWVQLYICWSFKRHVLTIWKLGSVCSLIATLLAFV